MLSLPRVAVKVRGRWRDIPVEARLFGRARLDRRTGCWLLQSHLTGGYGYVMHKGRKWRAHRLAFSLLVGPIPPGALVLHSCVGRRHCIAPAHLRPGTVAENAADAVSAGRVRHGSRHVNAKLTEGAVRRARRLVARSRPTWEALALEFGVAPATIWAAATGRTWRHVH
jgi:HNH endonuclease